MNLDEREEIDICCEWHTDYAWICDCGKRNVEVERRLDLEDGSNLFCNSCNKEYIINKTSLKLEEARD